MPRFYHGPSATPPALADAPLDALRSNRYPFDPEAPAQAYAQQGRPLPIGLPQRMMFERWKSGGTKVFGENAKSYVSARDFGAQHSGVLVDAAGVPQVKMTPASFATTNGATALTVQTIDPDVDRTPIARGFLPPDRYLSSADIARFIADGQVAKIEAQQEASLRASSAMNEIKAVRDATFARIRGR